VPLVAEPIEQLSATAFVLTVGLAFGVLQTVRGLVSNSPYVETVIALQVIIMLSAGFVWWAAVRRRRFSVLRAALHLVLAWDFADVLSATLTLAPLRDQIHMPLRDLVENVLSPYLVLSPIRYVPLAVLVAVGRLLPGSGRLIDSRVVTPGDPTQS
jgi:hypothetical protein